MPYVNTWVDESDILEELDDDELIAELERRGLDYNTVGVDADEMRQLLENIWLSRRLEKDYQQDLDKLIYGVLGKVL